MVDEEILDFLVGGDFDRMVCATGNQNNSGLTGTGTGLNEISVADSIALIVSHANALGNQTSNTPSVSLGDNQGTTAALSAAVLTNIATTYNNQIPLDRTSTGVLTVGGIHTSGTAVFTGNIAPAALGGSVGAGSNAFNVFQSAGGITTFSGTISDNASRTTALSKADLSNTTVGAVDRANSGVVNLTAANTYSGGTVVSAGTLLLNNTTGSATGTGSVSVNSGATLGGTGIISSHRCKRPFDLGHRRSRCGFYHWKPHNQPRQHNRQCHDGEWFDLRVRSQWHISYERSYCAPRHSRRRGLCLRQ